MTPREISLALARRIDQLVVDILPGGHRGGSEWVVESGASPFACSVSVHLRGDKAGLWSAWALGLKGDALNLVAAALELDIGAAMAWSRKWLGIDEGEAAMPTRPITTPSSSTPGGDPDRWRKVWNRGRPIADTLVERYLTARGVYYVDPHGDVLRFHPECARIKPGTEDKFERLPAMLALLRDVRGAAPTGVQKTFLLPDGSDRLRDDGGRRVTGRRDGSAVMLYDFDEVTLGLGITEGVETALAVLNSGWAPVWAMTSSGNLGKLPVLGGIEAITIFADHDDAGMKAASTCASRWRAAGREAAIASPPVVGHDWLDEVSSS